MANYRLIERLKKIDADAFSDGSASWIQLNSEMDKEKLEKTSVVFSFDGKGTKLEKVTVYVTEYELVESGEDRVAKMI